MTDIQTLEKKIHELEERIKKLEENAQVSATSKDDEYMDALYEKAKALVIKYNEASIIFLQKKFYIDYHRAKALIARLEKNGVIGPEVGGIPRKILKNP